MPLRLDTQKQNASIYFKVFEKDKTSQTGFKIKSLAALKNSDQKPNPVKGVFMSF
jgi:hypothetical protein